MVASDLQAFVGELAEESGTLIRRYFRSPGLTVDVKADQTPVTDADRGAEELLRRRILARASPTTASSPRSSGPSVPTPSGSGYSTRSTGRSRS